MEEPEVSIIPFSSAEIVLQQDKALIDMQIATARAYPRNVTRAVSNVMALVQMDMETAETCNYALKRGGKVISGPSVNLAKAIAQEWGNMRIEAKVVDISATQVTSEGIAFDLEKNLAIKVQVKRSIMGKAGRFSDDMITVTGNAANSIALRNAIFAVVPAGVVKKTYKAAVAMITGDVSTTDKLNVKRKQVIDRMRDTYKVTEEEILASIGKAAIDHVTEQDIVLLIGIGQAIKDGDTTIDEQFRPGKVAAAKSGSEKEVERFLSFIASADSMKKLEEIEKKIPAELSGSLAEAIGNKKTELGK